MMVIPTKQLKSGFAMPVYGFGTWMVGGDFYRNPDNDDESDINAIKQAIELGVTHIDTAEKYADGHAERLIGEAIKEFDREKLFIVSKVAPNNLRYADLIESARASLERVGTDYLDLYLIHSPNPDIPLKETMRAMDTLVDEGRIRNIGVSNFTVEGVQEAQTYTKNKIVANQLHLNLKFREPERKGLLKYCQENDMLFIAWRPVQKGVLAEQGTAILDEMARKYNKTPAQIAINWLISQPNIVTLSKTRSIAYLKENLDSFGWQLEEKDIERLRNEFPDQKDVSDSVPLI